MIFELSTELSWVRTVGPTRCTGIGRVTRTGTVGPCTLAMPPSVACQPFKPRQSHSGAPVGRSRREAEQASLVGGRLDMRRIGSGPGTRCHACAAATKSHTARRLGTGKTDGENIRTRPAAAYPNAPFPRSLAASPRRSECSRRGRTAWGPPPAGRRRSGAGLCHTRAVRDVGPHVAATPWLTSEPARWNHDGII